MFISACICHYLILVLDFLQACTHGPGGPQFCTMSMSITIVSSEAIPSLILIIIIVLMVSVDIKQHWTHPKDFCWVCTEFDSREISGQAQSLAHKGHPSIWWPHSVLLCFGFWEWMLLVCATVSPFVTTVSLAVLQSFKLSISSILDQGCVCGWVYTEKKVTKVEFVTFYYFIFNYFMNMIIVIVWIRSRRPVCIPAVSASVSTASTMYRSVWLFLQLL